MDTKCVETFELYSILAHYVMQALDYLIHVALHHQWCPAAGANHCMTLIKRVTNVQ